MSVRYLCRKNLLAFLQLIIFFSPLCVQAQEGGPDTIHWLRLETRHTVIQYQSLADLTRFHREVNFGLHGWGLGQLFASSASDDLLAAVPKQMDSLYERVQEILDMRKKMEKVTVNLYSNKSQLRDAYLRIYHNECRIRAWYQYENNAVYVTLDDLSEGILAHEMAHSIIDHYLLVRPPTASAEILARYVDEHLKN